MRPAPKEAVLVNIGEIRVAAGAGVLAAIGLGSCVAVALHDPVRRVAGLAHVMLPAPSNGRPAAPPGRFASSAVPRLVRLMEAEGADRSRLRARLAGGAAMFANLAPEPGLRLGARNVEASRAALEALGIPIVGEDVGGEHGRSVYLRAADGTIRVASVRRPDVLL